MDVLLLSELKFLMNNWVWSPSMDCLHLRSSLEKLKYSFFKSFFSKARSAHVSAASTNHLALMHGWPTCSWSRTQGCKLQGIRSSPTRNRAILSHLCSEDRQRARISAAIPAGVITQCKTHSQWTGTSSCSKYLFLRQSEDAHGISKAIKPFSNFWKWWFFWRKHKSNDCCPSNHLYSLS